jgi:hypothetical protein
MGKVGSLYPEKNRNPTNGSKYGVNGRKFGVNGNWGGVETGVVCAFWRMFLHV